jgi:hypothetical protein
MGDSLNPQEIQHQYQSGRRDFQGQQLRKIDLHGLDLRGVNLEGADLTEANLREVQLEGANLAGAYLNGADLSGGNLERANLKGASLLKTHLIRANLRDSNLTEALCTGAFFTKASLQGANLRGTFLKGASLIGADLVGAKYSSATHFDAGFNAEKAGLQKVAAPAGGTPLTARFVPKALPVLMTVEELLVTLSHLGELGNHYLGNTMASRYWLSARPNLEWFQKFEIERSTAQVKYTGSVKDKMTPEQIELAQQWVKKYVQACGQIFKEFPQLIEADRLVFPLS